MIALAMEAMYHCAVTFVCFMFVSTFPTRWISLAVDRTMTVVVAIETLYDLELRNESVCYIMTEVDVKTMVDVVIRCFLILHKRL